ncbi:Cyclic nucleotide-binding domain-containing protein 1 [Fukomys damarensis]|uniref:Cyclic nucleotide-binding domain-containing protein 1 n=1 Tax=Fukomys damarensis TaxID=885580 RepID=A0A091DIN3_FUKDA|nr:Cyclic nucleotide-binding domain-containing protein 1 [Fukomys damarensis]
MATFLTGSVVAQSGRSRTSRVISGRQAAEETPSGVFGSLLVGLYALVNKILVAKIGIDMHDLQSLGKGEIQQLKKPSEAKEGSQNQPEDSHNIAVHIKKAHGGYASYGQKGSPETFEEFLHILKKLSKRFAIIALVVHSGKPQNFVPG